MNANILSTILLLVLFSVLYVLREKRLRRAAQARLEIAKVVTNYEKLLLEGKIPLTDPVCHNHFHDYMLSLQYSRRLGVNWKFIFHMSSEKSREMKKRLDHEMRQKTEIGELLRNHNLASYKAFVNERPIASMFFWLLVFISAGGALMAFGALLAILGALLTIHSFIEVARRKHQEILINTAKWYTVNNLAAIPVQA